MFGMGQVFPSLLMLIQALVITNYFYWILNLTLGEGEMCAKTVWAFNKAGAAGLHLEDQEFPKRCGHLDGKTLLA